VGSVGEKKKVLLMHLVDVTPDTLAEAIKIHCKEEGVSESDASRLLLAAILKATAVVKEGKLAKGKDAFRALEEADPAKIKELMEDSNASTLIEDCVTSLWKISKNGTNFTSMFAMKILGCLAINRKEIVSVLQSNLEATSLSVKTEAALALLKMGLKDERMLQIFTDSLNSSKWESVRADAARGITLLARMT